MIPKCDLHTHTTYCDGKNTPEEMVLGAIARGCETFGFSAHSPRDDENDWCIKFADVKPYVAEIKALREKYKDKIELYVGFEYDILSDVDRSEFDYIIGSVHYVTKDDVTVAVDLSAATLGGAIDTLFGGDAYAFAKAYYENMYTLYERTGCDIVGHVDLITKFNEQVALFDSSDKRYRSVALDAVDYLLSKDRIFEINTGAISRGYRKTPYPEDFLLRHIAERGGRVMLNSDTHSVENIMFGFEETTEFAKACGVRELTVLKNGKFEQIGI